jgi:hypothetical protein
MPVFSVLINLTFLLLFFTAASPAFALSLDFSQVPSSVDQNQEFTVDVNLSCSSCSDSYLRGVFFHSGTNYFGFTKNNAGDWINAPGSLAASYYQVAKDEVKEGSWSGKLAVKPDPADSAFIGPGNYFFKIGRYTSGGSVTWAAAVPISISGPPPTSSPAPTSRPTTVVPSPTFTPTQILVSPTSAPDFDEVDKSESVLTANTELITASPLPSPTPVPILSDTSASSDSPLAILLIVSGILIVAGAFLLPFSFLKSS